MRKLFSLFIALALNAALWAQTQTVSYLYPEYNTEGDATSGIKEWQTDEVDATVIADTTTTLNAGWYVVTDDNVQTGTLTCNGAVHLILADGAKLTATGISGKYVGIIVSGTGNSLTIYGQAAQTGQLIANAATDMPGAGIGGGKDDDGSNITINGGIVTANAGKLSAGIGGGMHGDGSNITINGGMVTANGGEFGAGIGGGNGGSGFNITINGGTIAANGGQIGNGIGGGYQGSGSDITINGGIITANGGASGAGIGGGFEGTGSNITINNGTVTASGGGGATCLGGGWSGNGSNITVATNLYVRAGSNYPPTTLIDNDGTDIASKLAGSRYATIETTSLADVQAVAIAELSQYATDHPSTNGAAIVDTFTGNINAAQSTLAVADQLAAGKAAIDFDCLKDAAIAEINAAIEGLTLFQAEQNYIGYMIDDIRNEDDENLVKLTKQTTLEYIALHPAKLAAIADVKTAMGDLAESVIIYNYIGCLAIESAYDVSSIAEAKNAALAKMEEMSEILGAAYNIGDAAGYQRAFDELPTDPQDAVGTKVTITKGDKELKLVNPEKVEFGKQE